MPSNASLELTARLSMEKHLFRTTRSLGQNFLLDEAVLARIIELSGAKAGDHILEIGPGAGVMTAMLADLGAYVTAVEVDKSLEPVLREVLSGRAGARVVFADAMKTDLGALQEASFSGNDFSVLANIPYYITTDLIDRLLTLKHPPQTITIMVQKEAAERFLSSPGDKAWCAAAARVQYFTDARVVMDAPRNLFSPPPHVDSCLMRLNKRTEPLCRPTDERLFLRLIDAAFFMRRKTLANNLTHVFSISRDAALTLLADCALDERVRGETLSIPTLCAVSDALAAVMRDENRPLG